MTRFRRLLQLTDDQAFQLRSIVVDRNQQLEQLRDQDLNAQSRRAEIESIQRRFQSEVRRILTPAQSEKFDAELAARPNSLR